MASTSLCTVGDAVFRALICASSEPSAAARSGVEPRLQGSHHESESKCRAFHRSLLLSSEFVLSNLKGTDGIPARLRTLRDPPMSLTGALPREAQDEPLDDHSDTCANCGITYAAYFEHPDRCPGIYRPSLILGRASSRRSANPSHRERSRPGRPHARANAWRHPARLPDLPGSYQACSRPT